MDWHPIQRRVEMFPITSCYRNLDELRPDEPLGSYSDLTLLYNLKLIWIHQRRNSEKGAKRYDLHQELLAT